VEKERKKGVATKRGRREITFLTRHKRRQKNLSRGKKGPLFFIGGKKKKEAVQWHFMVFRGKMGDLPPKGRYCLRHYGPREKRQFKEKKVEQALRVIREK